MRTTLLSLVLVAGCSEYRIFGGKESEEPPNDTQVEDSDTPDSGLPDDTGEHCPPGPVTLTWGIPSGAGEPGCEDGTDNRCCSWGDVMAPGRLEGEERVWLSNSTRGSWYYDPQHHGGIFLLAMEDWALPVDESLEPLVINPTRSVEMTIAGTQLTTCDGHADEALWILNETEIVGETYWNLHLFDAPPAPRTDIEESDAIVTDVRGLLYYPLSLPDGDLDGDGLDDFVLMRDWDGELEVLFSLAPWSGSAALQDATDHHIEIDPDGVVERGRKPAVVDLDLDGHLDLLFLGEDRRFDNSALEVMVFYGPLLDQASLVTPDLSVASSNPDSRYSFAEGAYQWGTSLVLPGDLTGDSRPDLVFVEGDDRYLDDSMIVWILDDPQTGTREMTDDDLHLVSEPWNPSGLVTNIRPMAPGDMNGDGQDDLVVFAEEQRSMDNGSRAYLVPGPITESLFLPEGSVPFYLGFHSGRHTLYPVGDLDRDGQDDLALYTPYADVDDSDELWTRAWLWPGCPTW